ncbi:MAG: nitroreductase family protein [Spirosomaceae bacterium]|nr:nitroreductase family protein [Spirosomataceae bacterium]
MSNKHFKFQQNVQSFTSVDLIKKSKNLLSDKLTRRSLRFFSDDAVPKEVIENILLIASSAPSGANKQPWNFCAISNAKLKAEIRKAAEEEEYESYHGRMNKEWLEDLKKFDTNWQKPFLETAPWIIVVFKEIYEMGAEGEKKQNYYVNESVGIACGFLINAIHELGLVTLTHTPSPMNFLSEILNRPKNERPFLLLPVGYPAADATVPDIKKKTSEEVINWFE